MYLTISFCDIPEFKNNTYLYAYLIDSSDTEYDDNYYVFITNNKPCDYDDISLKIPDEFLNNLENYFLSVNSKIGYESDRENIIIFNSSYSPYIYEFNDDIVTFHDLNYQKNYLDELAKKKLYYNYHFDFNKMTINKNGKFANFLSKTKSNLNYISY